ncbi:MAG TPA: GDSL-type esterase/lipase family protein [Candidatus Paceibacterota bacterium]|nr:GDSL-type esterase/lipase family protein [Verrucomicrobiota bacterium]HSA11797.1 GDSL-type esterase/lipase family protein [Candidatus Paceibacterota bacterium]
MKPCLSLGAGVCAAAILSAATVAGQTNLTPEPHQCIRPVPREGQGHQRFLELNERVKQSQGRAEVIFVGDSITQGWEGNGKAVWKKYYTPRHALNLGIGSDHTQHVLWRLDNGNLDGLHPKAAVLLIGVNNIPHTNNTPRDVLEGVTAVVHKLREKLPEAKILLLGIFPFREDFCEQRGKALQVNQALRKLDDGCRVRFLDIGHLFIQPDGRISRDIMRDFLHLSPTGYRLWAEAIEPTLADMLGEKPITP